MNTVEKGKKGLNGFGIALLVISALCMILGVLGIVFGIIKSNIPLIVFGSIGVLIAIIDIVYGIVFVWTSKALVATEGNITEDNSIATKSVNAEKCQKCGMPLDPETKKCPNHSED